MANPTTVRLNEFTQRQIDELKAAGFGSFTNIVQTAIDRMYQQEKENFTMNEPVKVIKVNVVPELDPSHRDTRQSSFTKIWIDPESRKVWADQDYDDNSTPEAEWHGRIYTFRPISFGPDGSALKVYLESDEGQTLLSRICDGYETIWNGSNMVGKWTPDAMDAREEFESDIESLPENSWSFWDIDDWFTNGIDEITAETTDEELPAIAEELESFATGENVVLSDDVLEYVTDYRNELRDM